jgi:serine/threonine protein kinase
MSVDGASTQALASILSDIGASQLLQNFIDNDHDDDSLVTLSRVKCERLAGKYGLSAYQASSFVEMCGLRAGAGLARHAFRSSSAVLPSGHSPLPILSSASRADNAASSSPAPAAVASRLDDASLLRKLHLEVMGVLGKGGFGTVYKCKDAAQKRYVAVKLVNDPEHAQSAMREGQKLLRAAHKNIVHMHRVHDLDPILGNGTCALEMEAVEGGDLSQHLDAARRRPESRLPHAAVLRFTRQLLEILVYLHDEMKWLHGDIKPQNLLMTCHALPADGSAVDYSSAEIKLADFGLAKVMGQQLSSASFMLVNASTKAGQLKGTAWYLSPEALQGASGGYERTFGDDLWSSCLVIMEMDTGLPLQQLMAAPGAVKLDELLTRASPELLPLLVSVIGVAETSSRCASAAELLRKLDAAIDPLFVWQCFDTSTQQFVSVHPAASFALEEALSANQPLTMLPLQPPFDFHFDITDLLNSSAALGCQTARSSGATCPIRRLLKPTALTSSCGIPVWLQLVDGMEWLQCAPSMCAKLDIDAKNPNAGFDAANFKRMTIESSSIGSMQLPHAMKTKPYLAAATADDISMLTRRVHDSLPEWDITCMQQVVNPSLASKYAAYRHRAAARRNGDPNERMLFHFAPPAVIAKIWQEGEGHDPRLSQWAEVGKGAYFSEHVMYGYAYKYSLWPSSPTYIANPEPPIGESMQVFASLVCLGNVADVGAGCETCPSPAWDAWKKEPPVLPKPTRPPVMTLPSDAARKQHALDLAQVKEAPRYDSVTSTEGDLYTHPASTNRTPSRQRMCEMMHPRLRERAKEWGKQYIVFHESDSYPMFIITLTKTRDSPMGVQQLAHAGCDAARIKALGFTALQFKDAGFDVQPLKAKGIFRLDELLSANYDVSALTKGGYSVAELKRAGVTASQLKTHGCSAQQLKSEGFTAAELIADNFDMPSLIAGGYSVAELKRAGVTASQLKTHGCSAQLLAAAFSAPELQHAGFNLAELYAFGLDDPVVAAAKAYYSDVEFASQLCSEFAAVETGNPAMASLLSEAHSKLQLIVVHNAHLKSPLSERQPAWPQHEALMRFDLPLQRLTTFFAVTKKWFPRFFCMRGRRLYYSDGEIGHPDTQDGTLAFMLSNPAPDGRYCIDLQGMLTHA